MKPVKRIILGLLFIATISSCHKDRLMVIGTGSSEVETRPITGFTGIDLDMNARVYYLQDSIYSVEVKAQSNILKVVKTELAGNILKIESSANIKIHTPITITVRSPKMNMLHINGSGDINAQNTINTESLDVSINGSGTISIQSIIAQDITCKISGSGDIKLMDGTVLSENFTISGSGDIEALNVVSDTSVVNISGSGDMEIHVLKSLDATISGSGSVKYKGTPAVKAHISGSGKVVSIN